MIVLARTAELLLLFDRSRSKYYSSESRSLVYYIWKIYSRNIVLARIATNESDCKEKEKNIGRISGGVVFLRTASRIRYNYILFGKISENPKQIGALQRHRTAYRDDKKISNLASRGQCRADVNVAPRNANVSCARSRDPVMKLHEKAKKRLGLDSKGRRNDERTWKIPPRKTDLVSDFIIRSREDPPRRLNARVLRIARKEEKKAKQVAVK